MSLCSAQFLPQRYFIFTRWTKWSPVPVGGMQLESTAGATVVDNESSGASEVSCTILLSCGALSTGVAVQSQDDVTGLKKGIGKEKYINKKAS